MYHKTAVVSFEAFQKVMTKIQPSIAHQIDLASQQLVDSNRLKLRSIVETVLLCGRQNILLRGHRDSSCDVENCPKLLMEISGLSWIFVFQLGTVF